MCVGLSVSRIGSAALIEAVLFRNKLPLAWMAEAWSPDNVALFVANIGDPVWQAEGPGVL